MRLTRSPHASAILAALLAASVPALHAQVVSAGLTGVVRDTSGKPVAGARIHATHTPTNTRYEAVSRTDGRFDFRGLIVGGPYTIESSAEGLRTAQVTEVTSQLGAVVNVDVAMEPAPTDVVQLDNFVITENSNDLDAGRLGAGNVMTTAAINLKPTTQRSLADMISASPFVALRSLSGDREEAQITALGQNNRFNSIQIDGSRINDQFGLNATGLASFYNPLSLDTLEQLSVQVSPYEVRQSGFTGASINAVTKSGTNQFKGSAYYYFSGDHLWDLQLQGEDVNTRLGTGAKVVPKLERTTYGFTLGGPIIPNKVFFFLNYEKFERISAPNQAGLNNVDATQAAAILAKFTEYNQLSGQNFNWGAFGTEAPNISDDKKVLGKLDWNITSKHRASVRYSQTKGTIPQFGSYTSTSRTLTSVTPSLTSNGVTALDSHFYAQEREEKNLAAQVFSQWTADFKTEIRYSEVKQDQNSPLNAVLPEVTIWGLSGFDRNGRAITNGALVAGTELNRQGNEIHVKTRQYSVSGDYIWRNFVFSAGAEREWNDFYNLFRGSSYGVINFASVADFLNDTPARIERNVYVPSLRDMADLSDFATNGIFGQVKWNATSRLDITGGVRFEFNEAEKAPAFNQRLFDLTGFRNDSTLDGAKYVSPRVGFNLAVDEERKTQLRGGVGHFVGRAPWVFFSNSFNNIGVGSYTLLNGSTGTASPAQGDFQRYLAAFDPEHPSGTAATDNATLRRQVDWVDADVELPSVWRGNIAVDHRLSFLDTTATIELVQTKVDQALFITNENLRATTIGADGRQRFAGNPSTQANARYAAYTDLYRIQNVSAGSSTYVSFSWSRPMKNRWSFDATYTRGTSKEAQAIGQTTASGQWQRNVVFNQSTVENGTSDFEIKNRLQLSLAREFEFRKNWKTTASLYYEGRTGNPFSWTYSNDLNGDGQINDVIAVPTGEDDARFDMSRLTAGQRASYLALMESTGLSKYAGSYAPKNSFVQPWVNRLDLHFSQDVPVFKRVKAEVFLDWINFGSFMSKRIFNYFEEVSRKSNDVFRQMYLAPAQYGADGRIQPALYTASWRQNSTGATSSTFIYDNNTPTRSGFTLNSLVPVAPDTLVYDATQSRWRIQFGARIKF